MKRLTILSIICVLFYDMSSAQESDPFMVSVAPNDISSVINDSCNVEFSVYDIQCDSLKKLIYQKIEKSINSDYRPISHVFMDLFFIDEECFQVGIKDYSYLAALISSKYYGVTFVHDVPVFLKGKNDKSIFKLKEEKAYFKPRPYRGTLFCSPAEIYQYTFKSKEFICLYKVMK